MSTLSNPEMAHHKTQHSPRPLLLSCAAGGNGCCSSSSSAAVTYAYRQWAQRTVNGLGSATTWKSIALCQGQKKSEVSFYQAFRCVPFWTDEQTLIVARW